MAVWAGEKSLNVRKQSGACTVLILKIRINLRTVETLRLYNISYNFIPPLHLHVANALGLIPLAERILYFVVSDG